MSDIELPLGAADFIKKIVANRKRGATIAAQQAEVGEARADLGAAYRAVSSHVRLRRLADAIVSTGNRVLDCLERGETTDEAASALDEAAGAYRKARP
jgi:hypothetical protein